MPIQIRTIEEGDNEALAKIIRKTLEEFDVPREGTVYTDPTTDNLYQLFQHTGSIYYVAETEDGQLLGGCGLFPTANLPVGYAELVKLYLDKQARGKGIGKSLMEACFRKARDMGYSHLYLESFAEMESAVYLYQKTGFERLDKPLGDSGHFSCTVWMHKELPNYE